MQKLPVSITNWILLSDYLKESSEVRIFMKVIRGVFSSLTLI